MIKRCIVSLFSVICLFPITALTFNPLAGSVRTFWSDENGLPSNRVLDIMQDEVGYIWIASYEGLVRFDGQTFTEFTEQTHGFTGVSPRVLCEDVHGGIWIGTNSTGLYRYYNKTFTHYGIESGLPNISIRSLRFDKNNTLWVGTTEGIARMTSNGIFEPVVNEDGSRLGIVSFILPVRDSLFVGSNVKGISVIRDGKMIMLPFLEEIKEYSFASAYLDSDGVIWFGTNDGKIIKVKNERVIGTIAPAYLQGSSVSEFIKTIDGTMYIATHKGIITLRQDEADWFSEENGLPNNIVSCICADREENIWVGMEHVGIGKFSKGRFVTLTNAKSLPPVSINSVMEDREGCIWIAKDHGIVCLKADNVSAERSYQINAVVDILEPIRVRQIREEPDGKIFFSTYSDNGLLIFDPDGGITILSKEDGLPNNKVRFSYRSSDGVLWIGTTAGLAVYYNGNITSFTRADGLPNLFILSGIETSSGKMWFGTDGGGIVELSIADLETDRPRLNIENIYTKEDGLMGNIVFRIKEDANGNLWVCTGEGLTLYKHNTFYPANKAIGLYSGSVFNIETDALSNVWVITAKELLFVRLVHLVQGTLENRPAEHLFRYNRLDGLAGELAANAWAYINKNNTLFVPTLRGVAVCDPTYYVKNKHAPPVVIENIVVDGQRFEASDKPFTVQAQTQRVLFQFTALSFTIPERVYFEYQLEGYDTDWRPCGTTREIAYTNLRPGQYRFKVRAANNDGIINTEGTSVSFYKQPFFYQTLWFLLLVITSIAGLVLFAVHLRIKSLRLRAEELDRKVTEKTQELEQEKEKSDKLLRNTLPSSVIDELIKTGTSAPRMYPAVSVLFADLASFTEWSSNKAPADVIADLNTIFTQFDHIMEFFACERIKTLGDGYLACCGLRGEADHAERLTAAAIEMLRSLNDLNKKIDHAFKIKIGIDSGPITGGIVGVHKYIFDIFGDTVNTAFRLQAATAPMACTVSEKTAALIRRRYRLVKRPPRALKGKGTVSGYYVYYTADTAPPPFSRIKAEYDVVMRYFHSGQYKKCLAVIKAIDATVLEPEMVYNISIVTKRCITALNRQGEYDTKQ